MILVENECCYQLYKQSENGTGQGSTEVDEYPTEKYECGDKSKDHKYHPHLRMILQVLSVDRSDHDKSQKQYPQSDHPDVSDQFHEFIITDSEIIV